VVRDFIDFDAPSDAEIRSERAKAREMRKSRWWQQKTAPCLCHYCGQKVNFHNLTMDHLVPLARGGRSTKENLVPSCKNCNNLKKTMLPIEWQDYLDRARHESS